QVQRPDQRRGLKRVIGPLTGHAGASDRAQPGVGNGQQFAKSIVTPVAPLVQQLGNTAVDGGRRIHASGSLGPLLPPILYKDFMVCLSAVWLVRLVSCP